VVGGFFVFGVGFFVTVPPPPPPPPLLPPSPFFRARSQRNETFVWELAIPDRRSKFQISTWTMLGGPGKRVTAVCATWASTENGFVLAFGPHDRTSSPPLLPRASEGAQKCVFASPVLPGASAEEKRRHHDLHLHPPKPLPCFRPPESAQTPERDRVDQALASAQATVMKYTGFFRIETLAPTVCRVTHVVQVDPAHAGTNKRSLSRTTKNFLGRLHQLHESAIRSGSEVDAEMNAVFPPPPLGSDLTSEQVRCLCPRAAPRPAAPLTLHPRTGCDGQPVPQT
jgi:hypothetical protein